MDGAADVCVRRRKTAAERRAQRQRSDARLVSRLIAGLSSIRGHRGCALSQVGAHLLAGLRSVQSVPMPSGPHVDHGMHGKFAEAAATTEPGESVTDMPASGAGADGASSFVGNWEPLPHHVLLRTRVRLEPDNRADTLRFEEVGSVVYGLRCGEWLAIVPQPGHIRCCFEDGERILKPVPTFCARQRARVRSLPSDDSGTLRFLDVGHVVHGILRGRWLELLPGPGYVRGVYEDGECIMEQESSR